MDNCDGTKWVMLPFAVLFAGMAVNNTIETYSEATVERAAIEAGLEQVELDSGKIVWQKKESE